MSTNDILKRVIEKHEVSYKLNVIHKIAEFQEKKIISTMASLALTLEGHHPESKYIFNENLFYGWCSNHNLHYVMNKSDQSVTLIYLILK